MPHPTPWQFEQRFAVGMSLDHLWSETMGLPIDDKERVLASLVRVLERSGTPYALMGGVAVQLYTEEPRATADLDIALRSREEVPREILAEAGFSYDGEHRWSENWRGPAREGTPKRVRVAVQFSSDSLMAEAVDRAVATSVGDFVVRLVTMPDLVLLKLAAAEEETRRPSKRTHDVGDVLSLLEQHPELEDREIRDRLRRVRKLLV